MITNGHVVAGAERWFGWPMVRPEGRIIAVDHPHDLAILKLPATDKKMQALSLAPGSDLLVGETIIAVGHPFGFTNTVSTGIISALGREVAMPDGEVLTNLIQTNASINPGNSGGPMLNINGELIGINVALREGDQGIAFALNADTVQQVLARYLSADKIAHLNHGLTCREVVQEGAAARQQVMIDRVAIASPASAAGLRRRRSSAEAGRASGGESLRRGTGLWNCKPGDEIAASIVRNGTPAQVSLKLAGTREHLTRAGPR